MRKRKYRYKQQSNYMIYLFVLLVGFLIGISVEYSICYEPQSIQPVVIYKKSSDTYSIAEISLAAVDQEGNGVITPLTVELRPGNGKLLTNIEKLLFWIDTQYSIQIARDVAENLTQVNTSDYDLIYSIKTNATLIGGPSAGASLTVATIAALENKTLRKDVMMTGTINPGGTIGEVGGILEKAKAAKELGAELFIVPSGQGTQTYLKPEEKCTKRFGFIFCETTYERVTINIGEDVGISVIEVENIEDAVKYFIL